MTVKGAIFDLDGTLYFSVRLGGEIERVAVNYVADLKRIDRSAALELIRATRRKLSTETGVEGSLSSTCVSIGGSLRDLHHRFEEEIDPVPLLEKDESVVELLGSLAARFPLHIYTNNNVILSRKIMDSIGVSHLFTRVFTIEDSWTPKPDRHEVLRILNGTGLAPRESLFVGDRYDIDLRLPEEMGAAVHLVSSREDLLALNKYL